jgi:sensor domain CHASE-containing protein
MAKTVMLGLVAASVPVGADEPALWMQWGLAGVVVAYVLWRDWQRERRLSTAIEGQQRWIRETLVATLERNAGAMERMASWLERHDQTEPERRSVTRPLRAVEDGDGR